MKILIAFACIVASSSYAASVAESFFGEWKGEDGNIHVITAEMWTVILPNGLKKERKITVPSVIEKEDRAGVWVTFNPVETYYCRVFEGKMIRMGPYDYVGSIPSPTDTPNAKKLLLHASKIDPKIGLKVLEDIKQRQHAKQKDPNAARRMIIYLLKEVHARGMNLKNSEETIENLKKSKPTPPEITAEFTAADQKQWMNMAFYNQINGMKETLEKDRIEFAKKDQDAFKQIAEWRQRTGIDDAQYKLIEKEVEQSMPKRE